MMIEQSFASATVQVSYFFNERSIFFVAVMTSCTYDGERVKFEVEIVYKW